MKLNTSKVLYIGDSLVDNGFYSFQGDWQLAGFDATCHFSEIVSKTFGWEWVNTAVGGDTIANIRANLQTRVFDYNPTLVFIEGGYNDAAGNGHNSQQIADDMQASIQSILSKGIQVVLLWFPISFEGYNLSSYTDILSLHDKYVTLAKYFAVNNPDNFTFIDAEGSALGTTCADNSTINRALHHYDYCHFSPAGWCYAAGFIIDKLFRIDNSLTRATMPARVIGLL